MVKTKDDKYEYKYENILIEKSNKIQNKKYFYFLSVLPIYNGILLHINWIHYAIVYFILFAWLLCLFYYFIHHFVIYSLLILLLSHLFAILHSVAHIRNMMALFSVFCLLCSLLLDAVFLVLMVFTIVTPSLIHFSCSTTQMGQWIRGHFWINFSNSH